jgi:hypothetical protein
MRNRYYVEGDYAYIAIELDNKEIQCTTINTNFIEYLNYIDGLLKIYKDGYVYVSYKNNSGKVESKSLQRIVAKPQIGQIVDHINHDKLNNTLANLRCTSLSINGQNRFMNNSKGKSKCLNVSWSGKFDKWLVSLQVDGKRKCFGLFEDKKKAIKEAKRLRSIYYPGSQEYLHKSRMVSL